MIKKYSKMFAIALVALCFYIVPVSAMSVTLDTIGTATSELTKKLYGDDPINYFYVIGEYAYTNRHEIVFNDVAAGTRTIPTSIADKDMTIYYIEKDGDSWKVSDKIGGNLELPKSFVISKVDNERLYSDEVNTDEAVTQLVNAAKDAIINEDSGIHDAFKIVNNNRVITVKLLNRELKADDIHDTGLATVIAEIFNNKNYAGIKLTEVLPEESEASAKTVTILNEEDTDTTAIKNQVLKFLTTMGVTTSLDDLAGKAFTLEFLLANEDIANAEDAVNSYKFEFVSEVDTNEYFDFTSNGVNYKTSCNGAEDKKCLPVLNILNPNEQFNTANDFGNIVKNALNDKLISSVDVTVGNVKATYTSDDKTDIVNKINDLIKSVGIKQFQDFTREVFNGITIKFNIATDKGAISKYEDTTYKYEIGNYVDVDAKVEKIITENNSSNLGQSTTYNNYYNLSRGDGNNLIFNINLNKNSLYKFTNVLAGLDKIIFGSEEYSALKDQKEIQSIKINDQDFTMSNGNSSLESIIQTLTGQKAKNVTPSMLSNLVLDVTFKTADGKEVMPGTLGTVNEDNTTATYHISFNINNFIVDSALNGITDSLKHFTFTVTDKVITVKLSNISDKISVVDGAALFATLTKYQNLITKVDIDDNVINVKGNEELKTQIAEVVQKVLNVEGVTTIGDLANLDPITINITLENNVNVPTTEDEERVETLQYTLEFDSSATDIIITDENKSNLSDIIKAGAEKITLDSTISLGTNLKIEYNEKNPQSKLEIVGNGATINGNLEISDSAKNVTIKDLNVTGEVIISGENATIIGTPAKNDNGEIISSSTVINGALTVSAAGFNMDGVVVHGTDAKVDAATDSSKLAVIDAAKASDLTIKNSRIEYTGNHILNDSTDPSRLDSYVYSLVYANGKVILEGNTIDIDNVKNPIEFVYGTESSAAAGTSISNNHFVGKNYIKNESHNVISIYNVSEVDEVININNNTFEYASSVLRISNLSDKKVTFNVNDNIVKNNKNGDNEKTDSLIVVRVNNTHKNISNIYINATGNKLADTNWNDSKLVQILDDNGGNAAEGKLTLNNNQYPVD